MLISWLQHEEVEGMEMVLLWPSRLKNDWLQFKFMIVVIKTGILSRTMIYHNLTGARAKRYDERKEITTHTNEKLKHKDAVCGFDETELANSYSANWVVRRGVFSWLQSTTVSSCH